MFVETTQQVMMQYFNSAHSDVSMMANDVGFTMMATGEETKTPDGVLAMLNYFYHVAFDAQAEMKNTMFVDGQALASARAPCICAPRRPCGTGWICSSCRSCWL